MTERQSEAQFVARIRASLEQDSERLAPGIRTRLRRMRHEALTARRAPSRPRGGWRYAAGALAATAAVAGLVMLLPINHAPEGTPLAAMDDLDILAASEPLEIFEDMEFYTWLSDLEHEIQNS
jgi:hypothetical protein